MQVPKYFGFKGIHGGMQGYSVDFSVEVPPTIVRFRSQTLYHLNGFAT